MCLALSAALIVRMGTGGALSLAAADKARVCLRSVRLARLLEQLQALHGRLLLQSQMSTVSFLFLCRCDRDAGLFL